MATFDAETLEPGPAMDAMMYTVLQRQGFSMGGRAAPKPWSTNLPAMLSLLEDLVGLSTHPIEVRLQCTWVGFLCAPWECTMRGEWPQPWESVGYGATCMAAFCRAYLDVADEEDSSA